MPLTPFLETIIRFLMPYFAGTAIDPAAARAEILETLASYGTRTRAELLNAAQIIAFGMATLEVLAEAKEADMSMSMRIRFRGCANGLNRACKQTEKSLDRQLAQDPPAASEPAPDPSHDVADIQAADILRQARIRIDAARPAAKTPDLTERNKRAWGAAMIEVLEQMGMRPGGTATPAT